jgi:hypothetical protein
MDECTVTSGFLIEKTFARMCRECLAGIERGWPHLLDKGGYSTPHSDVRPEQMPKQYRGLHREPIQGWAETLRDSGVVEPTDQELAASLFLDELNAAGKAADDFIFALDDAKKLLQMIGPPVEREIIWAKRMDAADPAPPETVLLGYEPSAFYPPDCNSAVAEGMFFTRWIRECEESPQLKVHHAKLNRWGLFGTPIEAEQYLQAYLSSLPTDWDERRYTYYTTEVRALPSGSPEPSSNSSTPIPNGDTIRPAE